MNTEPTERQREVMQAIASYHKQRGYAPSFRDIQQATGYKAIKSVQNHVRYLSRKGLVGSDPGIVRSLHLTKAGETVLKEVRSAETPSAS